MICGIAPLPAAFDLVQDPDIVLTAPLPDELASGLVQMRVGVAQYNKTYYVRDGDDSAALPAMMAVASNLCAAGREAPRKDLRLAAGLFGTAIDDFASVRDRQFLGAGGSTGDILAAYARAHHHAGQG